MYKNLEDIRRRLTILQCTPKFDLATPVSSSGCPVLECGTLVSVLVGEEATSALPTSVAEVIGITGAVHSAIISTFSETSSPVPACNIFSRRASKCDLLRATFDFRILHKTSYVPVFETV